MYESMKDMLHRAHEGGYAVMAINAINLETARGIIAAAEELRAPIIIDLLQDQLKAYFDGDLLIAPLRRMAEASHVPVAVNLDHGHDIAHLKRCLHEGFSSVMCDASALPVEENIRITQAVVELAQIYGASVEAEVGCMGCSQGAGAHFTDAAMYTDPHVAIDFIQRTGIDCLAVSYGSTHGDYPPGYVPTFQFEIVEQIKEATGLPLVLHGGSGAGKENIQASVRAGINKINVGTDYMVTQRDHAARTLAANPACDWPQLLQDCWAAGSEKIKTYIELSGSAGKAH
ncbi:class II fructose-bisphosphate aldolase [Collinsella sp. AGMB00827]|uniref:Class II fructose-bisphosphate aldolase n=1 Tax=Collinsella ureilytica TaxID=2869515 RepID=A0ABS7MK22_9ACTN|nr:class II fructose-bisphosphate aldolase [Collinsella urealyticum]MBY4797714.1 class II fructose-bisphosphate aldolase [Collinsella urealyticum]